MGHGHDHGPLDPQELGLEARRITWIGLVCNLILAVAKAIGGTLSGSAALVADAGHSFSDLLSDGVTLWAIRMSRIPRDENHPYGHGRFETLGSLMVALLLLLTGIGAGLHAYENLSAPHVPGTLALWLAAFSIAVKEALFWGTWVVGKRQNSRVLIANAWHHRSDALSSVAAFAGIGGALLGYPFLDSVAGFLVSGLIVMVAWEIGRDSVRELTDEALEGEVTERIHQLIEQVEGVCSFHQVRVRRMGSSLLVDMHVEVGRLMTVSAAHQVAERVRWVILEDISEVNEVLVHVDAEDDIEEEVQRMMRPQNEIEQDLRRVLTQVPEVLGVTHIFCHFLNQRLTVQVNLIMDAELRIAEAQQVAARARQVIESIDDIDAADIHLELHDGGEGHDEMLAEPATTNTEKTTEKTATAPAAAALT